MRWLLALGLPGRADAFAFGALIGAASLNVLEFLCPAARPVDHHSIDGVAPSNTERHRQLRLGEVARPVLTIRECDVPPKNTRMRAPMPSRFKFGSDEGEPDAAVARRLIVAKEDSRTIDGHHQLNPGHRRGRDHHTRTPSDARARNPQAEAATSWTCRCRGSGAGGCAPAPMHRPHHRRYD